MELPSKQEALRGLAKRVKELRQNKGVSQQEAYIDTSIHFGRIEQGKRDVSYYTLIRIALYFEISLKDLLNFN